MNASHSELAAQLIEAAAKRTGMDALTTSSGPFDAETAYHVQDAVVAGRLADVVGAKLGLTSEAKRRQMNVAEPLYGWLTADMVIDVGQPLPCGQFIQPRCEPEIVFIMGAALSGPAVASSASL